MSSPLVVFVRSHRRAVIAIVIGLAVAGIAIGASTREPAPPVDRIEVLAMDVVDEDPMFDVEQSSYDIAPGPLPMLGRVVKVQRAYHCGVLIGVSQILYESPFDAGVRFAIAVPCLEFTTHTIRFSIGDLHSLHVDDEQRVLEIRWNDKRHRLMADGLPSVIMPAEGFAKLTWMHDGSMHYTAGTWHWP